MAETVQTAFANKIVVRHIPGAYHCVFDGDCIDSVWEYELISCDIDPALKILEYEVARIPDSCFDETVAKLIASTPRKWTKQVDDPSVCIDDNVLDLMRSRGVEVEYVHD